MSGWKAPARPMACGCAACRAALDERFTRLMHRTFDAADEANLRLLIDKAQPPAPSVADRINQYGFNRRIAL